MLTTEAKRHISARKQNALLASVTSLNIITKNERKK
jgi:hypothetical protein